MSNACGSSSLWRPVLYSCVACYWETWALDVREQLGQRGLQQGWPWGEKPATDSFYTRRPPPRPLCFQYKTAASKPEALPWRGGNKDTMEICGGKDWKSVLLDLGAAEEKTLCAGHQGLGLRRLGVRLGHVTSVVRRIRSDPVTSCPPCHPLLPLSRFKMSRWRSRWVRSRDISGKATQSHFPFLFWFGYFEGEVVITSPCHPPSCNGLKCMC